MTDQHLDRRALLIAGAGITASTALMTFGPAAAGTTRTKVFTGRFRDPNGPDWVYLPFQVPTGVNRISVAYTYEPIDYGVYTANVVDIGIFDSSGRDLGNGAGFRGWSGGSRRSFSLSRTSATPGYLAGPINPGRWRIALGPYQIAQGGTPYRVEVTLHHGPPGPRFQASPAPAAIPGTGPGWYRGDLHVHTVHSDGSQTQADVIRDAKAAGLDFIGSSEHNTSSAQRTWGRHLTGANADLLVIPGEEVTTRSGHWLAAGLPTGTWIDWRFRPNVGNGHAWLRRFTDLVRSKGGLAIAAHPYSGGAGNAWGFGYDFAHMDAVEVWNASWDTSDEQTLGAWHRMLAQGRYLPAVGNSDTHRGSQQIGLAQTVVRAASLSAADLVAGYRAGHSWIAESSAVGLTFTATLGDTVATCGEGVDATAADNVVVRLEATGVPGCLGQVRGPAGILAGAVADASGRIGVETTVAGDLAFVRAEVRRPPGVVADPTAATMAPMVALTNPVFVAASGSSRNGEGGTGASQ